MGIWVLALSLPQLPKENKGVRSCGKDEVGRSTRWVCAKIWGDTAVRASHPCSCDHTDRVGSGNLLTRTPGTKSRHGYWRFRLLPKGCGEPENSDHAGDR